MKEISAEQIEVVLKSESPSILYFYTPMCGTCQVAEKMLKIIEELFPDIPFSKNNVNFSPDLAVHFKIESVPCLLMIKDGAAVEKIYAFQSVPFLYERIVHFLSS